ncbi:hypothetical protein MPDQ_004080 [Monascus purpureus]|uniref:protein-histidine N-methyltransferase n=1 Tax=Monascus purpureus TaxID=5098 RepID=A0A507R291_MONPU|nr:hypothetical protein MPDQ_004080 [Monascus purpureus]
MASTFSFGFSGDDIDEEDAVLNNLSAGDAPAQGQSATADLPRLVQAEKHNMREWLSDLPSQIFYNRLPIRTSKGRSLIVARREVFDIRAQLMAEDSVGQDHGELIAGLEEGDLKPNFYEGGFKTWECALDLAKLVVDEDFGGVTATTSEEDANGGPEDFHIIELGAGTAVPSLALFAELLSQPHPDYNDDVLHLVTLPNLLLTWKNSISSQEASEASTTGHHPETHPQKQEDELDITAELVESFQRDLADRDIVVNFISGAWSSAFVDLVLPSTNRGKKFQTLILASETIYSPSSLGAFSETLLELLHRSTTAKNTSRALVAAKKVYFGVGGGVDEFLSVLKDVGGDRLDIQEKRDIKMEGVGRLILEITESER